MFTCAEAHSSAPGRQNDTSPSTKPSRGGVGPGVALLAANLLEQDLYLLLSPAALILCARVGKCRKGKVILAGVDSDLGQRALGIRARPLALPLC